MSEEEIHVGKLKKVEVEVSAEETAREILQELDIKRNNYYFSALTQLREESTGAYVVLDDDTIWEVVADRSVERGDVFIATQQPDGTIDFVLRYYNGGCGFSEALEEAVKNLK